MTPGRLIADARRRSGLSQSRLARRAGTSQAAISRLEHDRLSPTFDTVEALLLVMGESVTAQARRIDWGHDFTQLDETLRLTPAERLERCVEFAEFARELRAAAE